jgi:hypothetical protein
MTDIKGNGNDPFLYVVGGYANQGVVDGCGYTSKIVGVVGGVDFLHKFDGEKRGSIEKVESDEKENERYLRLGLALAYLKGCTTFDGDVAALKRTSKENMYSGSLFAAYESFSHDGKREKDKLKTNINLFSGFEHVDIGLHRTNPAGIRFNGDVNTNIWFAHGEFIKNIRRIGDWQFGPWVFIKYNHITQGEYTDTAIDPVGIGTEEHCDRCTFDLLDVVLGLNLECEKEDRDDDGIVARHEGQKTNPSWRFFLKGGYGIQPIRRCSTAGTDFPVFLHLPKYYGVVSAGFRRKFNENWELTGTYRGTYGRHFIMHIAALGIGYNF